MVKNFWVMAVKFSNEMNPQNLLSEQISIIKFDFWSRSIQYLDFFGIISSLEHRYNPLNLTFDTYDDLKQFLFDKRIAYFETDSPKYADSEGLPEKYPVVDLSRIYGKEIDLETHILQYKFYSVNEIAELLSFSRPTVYKLIKEGELKASRINKHLRIKHSDYVEYVTTGA